MVEQELRHDCRKLSFLSYRGKNFILIYVDQALNSAQYEANGGANCGQWMSITNTQNGKTVEAYVADECPTCAYGSLDMSPSLFGALSNNNFDEGGKLHSTVSIYFTS